MSNLPVIQSLQAPPDANGRRNPSQLGFPPSLAVELALGIDTPKNICAAYGIDKAEFAQILRHPLFVKQYQSAMERIKIDGGGFRLKAQIQAEAFLEENFKMVTSPGTSDAVRARMIENTVRWAGYDQKVAEGGGTNNNFQININLG